MKINLKRNKGITLIALVITIIVLLILAGVSIAMLTGQNGILTQAQNASTQTEIAEAKEQAQMDILAWQSAQLENGQDATLNDETIKTILTGDSIDCFRRYSSELSPEEQEEIIKGIEEGLTDQDVKRYFTLVGAEKMRQYRRVLMVAKIRDEDN